MQENKENLRLFSNTKTCPKKPHRKYMLTPDKILNRNNQDDTTIVEEKTFWHSQSDETFETIERMCNKTLSDPENSIHDYLANWEKKHSQDSKSDDEALTIGKLFEEFAINDSDKSKLANQTQISEVEPPSCLWENTVNNESCFAASPIKAIGHLRPSTILEESATDSINSSNSFKSASPIPDIVTSDQYETANETQTQSTNKHNCSESSKSGNSSHSADSGRSTTSRPDASSYFEMFPLKKIPYNKQIYEPRIYNKSIFLKGTQSQSAEPDNSVSSSNDTSKDISSFSMDSLEKPRKRRSKSRKYFNDSFDFSKNSRKSLKLKKNVKRELQKTNSMSKVENDDENSVIVISDEEGGETTSSDDLNRGFMRGIEEPTDDSVISSEGSDLNVSHEFNDTLEEIEYIMKQGQKYLHQNASPLKVMQSPKVAKTPISSLALMETPKVQKNSVFASSPVTPSTVIKRPRPYSATKNISPLHAKALKAKPPHRFDDRFNHIVSPIRAYIHNTPKSPMTVNMKTTENIFDSEFSRDSRPPSRVSVDNESTPSKVLCSLPRKAYVSADYNHIVDERSPISIPGGDKIHRILEIGMAPAVLKHEGKFKTTMTPRYKRDVNNSEDSFADFSLASGDMSVLLLKDAKHLASKY